MQVRRLWIPVVFVGACVLVGWLCVAAPQLIAVLLGAALLALVVGFAVRFARAPEHKLRAALAPAGDATEGVQDIYLGRPRHPVTYGGDTPDPDQTLFVDAQEPEPGDLRGQRPAPVPPTAP